MTNITQRILKTKGRNLEVQNYDRKVENRLIWAGIAGLLIAAFGQCFV